MSPTPVENLLSKRMTCSISLSVRGLWPTKNKFHYGSNQGKV
eukprot:CAMPEP_0183329134 /NCGR_PEP_ID=MMETSP0160_2-20130417/84639_1 /TAXON_ID=2839 ORGANISM="Odontella Sinensis, Strain Grunow 1884" /NCGR_SAMPLE_ID=MMETSP0160_2 /ASSEMBLY_ACC=CAM_ASM_000250 /LENGTH=41 /DNA_ID= /DNA_START= /DNA_END= /DNA_ORIENTATION=